MSWICPDCNKQFAKPHQWHQCVVMKVETLFYSKRPELHDLYSRLLSKLKSLGEFSITTSLKAITLYAPNHKSFLVIEPKKQWLDVWFPLDRRIEEFPVFKILQPSKKRFAHFVRLQNPEGIEDIPMAWLKESYLLILNS